MEKKNTAIVLGGTSNHIGAMALVVMDIKKYSPNLADEIVIFYDSVGGGVNNKDKKLINNILPTRFIEYNFPIKDTSIFNQGTLAWFSKMVFCKFECLRLLDDYKNVIWLDYDIVIQKDISELALPSNTGIKFLPSGSKVSAQFHEPLKEYDMNKDGICGSTFVFQDNLKNYNIFYNFCYKAIGKYGGALYMGEQGIFDIMFQEFGLEWDSINSYDYTVHPDAEYSGLENHSELIKKAKIIHSYGAKKFWNGIENKQWNDNYKHWLSMGGSKVTSKKRTMVDKIAWFIPIKKWRDAFRRKFE